MSQNKSLSYKSAGVNIDAGNTLVEQIKPHVKRTTVDGVLGGIGGFGGLFELPTGYKQPVLVSGTDGVGTKLKLAIAAGKHDTIGIDLVAMCVNDIIVTGARPLYFLDYYATGALHVDIGTDVVAGIAEGCVQSGCALIGGETAEMPGMYAKGDYDLAGFAVGIVEKAGIIDGSKVSDGDVLIGLASSGVHSNGYSLVRKVLEVSGTSTDEMLGDITLNDALLAPTHIYVKPLLKLIETGCVHALSHITGGGLIENIPRVLPEHLGATIDGDSWARPAVFDFLQETGNITDLEMHRTFNNGIGMVIVVPASEVDAAVKLLETEGEQASVIGHITARTDEVVVIT